MPRQPAEDTTGIGPSNRDSGWTVVGTYGPLAWLVAVAGIWIGALWITPFDSGYTAGEMYDHWLSWRESGVLYPSLDNAPWRVLNYPPLVFALVGWVSEIGIPPLATARFVTVVSLIASIVVLYRWVRAAGADRGAAFAVAGLPAASFAVLHAAGQFRVELPAVALTLVGLYLLHAAATPRAMVAAGAALALACFAKQTQVIFPVIGFLWLARYHRRRLLPFAAGTVATAAAGAVLVQGAFGPEVWRHLITYTVGTYSFFQLVEQFTSFVLPWCVFLALALWLAKQEPQSRRDLRWWYFVGSSVWLFAAAREGSSSNYFIDWAFATLLWTGPWIGARLASAKRRPVPRFVTLALGVQIVGAGAGTATALFINVAGLLETRAALPALCEAMSSDQRIVPMESPGLARACGYQAALHPFIISNLAARGLWDEQPFLDDLADGVYPVVVVPFDPGEPDSFTTDRWTPRMIETIAANYAVTDRVVGWHILRHTDRP